MIQNPVLVRSSPEREGIGACRKIGKEDLSPNFPRNCNR